MNEYVVMPATDWQDVLDSVREKAGIYDAIKSGDLASIIDSISSGIGIDCLSAITGGTFTPSSDIRENYEITHDLGTMPNFFIITSEIVEENYYVTTQLGVLTQFRNNGMDKTAGFLMTEQYYNGTSTYINNYGCSKQDTKRLMVSEADVSSSVYAHAYTVFTENTINPCLDMTCKLKAGHKYNWVCGVINTI